MNEILDAATELQTWFDHRGWPNCIVGGLAVIRWGRPRTTVVAGFSLLTGFGSEREFLNAIHAAFPPREPGEIDFALRNRVYRGFATNGVPIDIGLGAFPYEEQIIARSRSCMFDSGHSLRVCDLHDLVVMKAFAGREQDWADLQYLVAWQRESIDWNKVVPPLDELCGLAENFDSVPRLAQLRHRIAEINRDN